jgi:hypothetical protein
VGTGDFNGDQSPDILLHNQGTGQIIVWYLKGSAIAGNAVIGTAAAPWQVAGSGDFNRDQYPDLLLCNSETGQIIVWYLKGGAVTGNAVIGTAAAPWQVAFR